MLTRMREAYDETGSTEKAIELGLARTGKLVTSAALILMFAFLVLSSSPGFEIKEFAIGLAAGIIFDATVIRALLVPALMRLLGRANWWMPSWAETVLFVRRPPEPLPEPARESTSRRSRRAPGRGTRRCASPRPGARLAPACASARIGVTCTSRRLPRFLRSQKPAVTPSTSRNRNPAGPSYRPRGRVATSSGTGEARARPGRESPSRRCRTRAGAERSAQLGNVVSPARTYA